jgi:hypothetical protein
VASRVQIDQDAMANVDAAVQQLFEERLGPDIARDARRYCPVDTGALRESVEHHMEGRSLIVSASGGRDGQTYALYVEMGTRPHVIRAHGDYSLRNRETGQGFGPVVHHPGTRPQPFLRPALYQQRSG